VAAPGGVPGDKGHGPHGPLSVLVGIASIGRWIETRRQQWGTRSGKTNKADWCLRGYTSSTRTESATREPQPGDASSHSPHLALGPQEVKSPLQEIRHLRRKRCPIPFFQPHPRRPAGLADAVAGEQAVAHGLSAQGVLRSTLGLPDRGLGAPVLRAVAGSAQVAAAGALPEVRRHD
jgi:hypothetical protein